MFVAVLIRHRFCYISTCTRISSDMDFRELLQRSREPRSCRRSWASVVPVSMLLLHSLFIMVYSEGNHYWRFCCCVAIGIQKECLRGQEKSYKNSGSSKFILPSFTNIDWYAYAVWLFFCSWVFLCAGMLAEYRQFLQQDTSKIWWFSCILVDSCLWN